MLTISVEKFIATGVAKSFIDELNRAIDRGEVSTDASGRLKTRATLRSVAGMMFYHNGMKTNIAALLAKKNGYDGDKLCLRGSDFVGVGADLVYDTLLNECAYLLPTSKATPKVEENNVGDAEDVLAACGL